MSARTRGPGARWIRAAVLAVLVWGLACGPGSDESGEPTRTAQAPAAAAAPADRRGPQAPNAEERRTLWRRRLGIPEDPEQRRQVREQAEAQDRELVPRLDAEEADVRAEAVRTVDLQGPGRERVFALAIEDPVPAVRVAALERLYEEDAHTARKISQRSLTDRDPEVVLAAIEVLGVVGDASSVPELEPLAAAHEDPRVRAAAAETLEFLR